MNRRNFCAVVGFGGAGLAALPTQLQAESARAALSNETQKLPYYDFSQDGTECVIHRLDTPLPWLNLLNNDIFQAWVTHRGNFECMMLDRGLNGLTNPEERTGYLYVRDNQTGEFFLLNRPAQASSWECRQGLGFTAVSTGALGLKVTAVYCVPRQDNLLLWLVTIENTTAHSRTVDIFSTVEWSLGDQFKTTVFCGHGGGGDAYTGGSQFNLYKRVYLEDGILYAQQQVWKTLGIAQRPWPYTGFFASSLPIESFDCVKSTFLGKGRTIENPEAVERGHCSNIPFWSQNESPWGVLHNHLRVPANGKQEVVLLVGMERNKSAILDTVRKYSNPSAGKTEIEKVKVFWQQFIRETINVETPEKEIDRTLNIWTKYQWRSFMMRGQNSGLRGLGLWSHGLMGSEYGGAIREVVVQPHDLKIVKEAILLYLSLQNKDLLAGQLAVSQPLMRAGDLGMQWPVPSTKGPFRFPHSHEINNLYPIAEYTKETRDLSFLDYKVPYIDGGEGTVFEHVSRGIEYALQGLSDRGLPRLNLGIGDWNDELNMVSREGRGESVLVAMEICYMLKECSQLAQEYGRAEEAQTWRREYDRLKSEINRNAWDGEWYVRAFADGQPELVPIGTSKDREGQIYLLPQVWAVISGVADSQGAQVCMKPVEKYLVSEFGPMLFAPPYSKFDPHVGTQSEYAPGWRNSCIYPRPAGWAIIAACLADLPDMAFEMYKRTSLSERSKDVERYQNEPYAYSENYVGPAHRLAGLAQFQWNLGEGANWMWHSYVYYILGIRPVFPGLLVDPKIPKDWPRFRIVRPFRNARYEITVSNPRGMHSGVNALEIDGKHIEGNIIPSYSDEKTHYVEAVLG